MSNTSKTDNFERIAEDLIELLIPTIAALTAGEAERRAVKLVVSLAAGEICKRAIALTAFA